MHLKYDEKLLLLKISRRVLEENLLKKRGSTKNENLPDIFNENYNIDVTLWAYGRFRGSRIIFKKPLLEGLIAATQDVSVDSRFSPLRPEDLTQVRIELSIWKDNYELIQKQRLEKDLADYSKGYLLSNGNKKGFLLPIIFNTLKVKTLSDIYRIITLYKMDYSQEGGPAAKNSLLFCFQIENFIEGESKEEVLCMSGPLVIKNENSEANIAMRAGNWLTKMQTKDGGYISIIERDSLQQEAEGDFTARTTLAAWGLSEFAKATGEKKFLGSARKYFLQARTKIFRNEQTILTLIYLGRLALSLNEKTYALTCAQKIKNAIAKKNTGDPISQQQLISFFLAIYEHSESKKHLEICEFYAEREYTRLLQDFRKNGFVNISYYIELPSSLLLLHKKTNNEIYRLRAKDLMLFILSHQTDNGSFKITRMSSYSYTRLDAKVIEILPHFMMYFKELEEVCSTSYDKAVSRMCQLQYDYDNTFFIDQKIKEKFIGGFRHDEGDYDAWIDSAGHFLLGVSRKMLYLKKNNRSFE